MQVVANRNARAVIGHRAVERLALEVRPALAHVDLPPFGPEQPAAAAAVRPVEEERRLGRVDRAGHGDGGVQVVDAHPPAADDSRPLTGT